ncbi:hypothetical protein AALP_AA2G131400 [Arabis alpina]|uniref:AD domain-containing protein n=1 Tax=Arabis alpina TaxID=50452 RepID=A0A087HH43_ARAAL|nr:hypothetical protein AALP_AA2G131400 [Arabis alpina]
MSQEGATVVEDEVRVCGIELAVGKTLSVTLTTGIEFKGIVSAYDSNIVIFQDGVRPVTGDTMTTRMVNTNFISNLTDLWTLKNEPLEAEERSIDLEGLITKEDIAIRDIEKRGVGVTKEAQSIFNALSKTHTVKWEKKDILVMGVRICSPYTSDCVTGGTTSVKNEVKRLLKEIEKLQLGSGTEGK